MAKNLCRACSYTWHPRGSLVSRVCPNCKSPNVMFVPRTNPLAGCGTVILGVFGASAVLLTVIVVVVGASCGTKPTAKGERLHAEPPPETATAAAAGKPPTAKAAPPAVATVAPVKADSPPAPAVGCAGACTCGDGSCGCCGRGCCSHHGGVR